MIVYKICDRLYEWGTKEGRPLYGRLGEGRTMRGRSRLRTGLMHAASTPNPFIYGHTLSHELDRQLSYSNHTEFKSSQERYVIFVT